MANFKNFILKIFKNYLDPPPKPRWIFYFIHKMMEFRLFSFQILNFVYNKIKGGFL
ncbi:hypothetical protein HMPREF3189_00890 [Clostridiales bacterium KA00134]|nr:hypothetical protein HMPREF3189_00890 [Clostridiales bacterium KA00134]